MNTSILIQSKWKTSSKTEIIKENNGNKYFGFNFTLIEFWNSFRLSKTSIELVGNQTSHVNKSMIQTYAVLNLLILKWTSFHIIKITGFWSIK